MHSSVLNPVGSRLSTRHVVGPRLFLAIQEVEPQPEPHQTRLEDRKGTWMHS